MLCYFSGVRGIQSQPCIWPCQQSTEKCEWLEFKISSDCGRRLMLVVDASWQNVPYVSPGLHRLQWLSVQKNGLHPSSFSSAGQSLFMIVIDVVYVLLLTRYTLYLNTSDDVFVFLVPSWSEWWPAQWRSRGRSPLCVCSCFTWGKCQVLFSKFWTLICCVSWCL